MQAGLFARISSFSVQFVRDFFAVAFKPFRIYLPSGSFFGHELSAVFSELTQTASVYLYVYTPVGYVSDYRDHVGISRLDQFHPEIAGPGHIGCIYYRLPLLKPAPHLPDKILAYSSSYVLRYFVQTLISLHSLAQVLIRQFRIFHTQNTPEYKVSQPLRFVIIFHLYQYGLVGGDPAVYAPQDGFPFLFLGPEPGMARAFVQSCLYAAGDSYCLARIHAFQAVSLHGAACSGKIVVTEKPGVLQELSNRHRHLCGLFGCDLRNPFSFFYLDRLVQAFSKRHAGL